MEHPIYKRMMNRGTTILRNLHIYVKSMEFQDPKMEVLYHIRPYFVGIFPYIGLI